MIKVDLKKDDLVFNKKFKNIKESAHIVLFALDVIEHFPNEKLFIWLEKCIEEFSNPSLIIIKIPSRNGLMLRLSFYWLILILQILLCISYFKLEPILHIFHILVKME